MGRYFVDVLCNETFEPFVSDKRRNLPIYEKIGLDYC